MKVVVFLHEEDVGEGEEDEGGGEVNPMDGDKSEPGGSCEHWAEVDEAERHR